MAVSPGYASTAVRLGIGTVITGDTSRTAPTNKTTIFTAGSNGSRLERVKMIALGSTTATSLRLFLFDSTNYRLWKEIVVPAVTPSAGSIGPWEKTMEMVTSPEEMPQLLPNGWSVVAAVNDTQGSAIQVIVTGGDF